MASNLYGSGVKIFAGTDVRVLETDINSFLSGDGTTEFPKKTILVPPTFFSDGAGNFYSMIYFTTSSNTAK